MLAGLGRFGVTVAVVAVAAFVAWRLWTYYMVEPWTRDGRVRADVVGVAPDVTGLVAEVLVKDNQAVRAGDVILRVDRARFEFAVQQAQATAESRRAALQEAGREAARYSSLSNVSVSQEKQQQTQTALQQAAAAYQQAQADLALANLNLERTEVKAPVNGVITNFDLRPGDYVTAGHPVTALVDTDSIHVDGYFEETKLGAIHPGDKATVQLLGGEPALSGRVDSIAGAIEDRERGASANLLANINPTFSWVRLAQRVPVRVALDPVPAGVRLIPGRTATVIIHPGSQGGQAAARAASDRR
jgi:RND family efflux transporter MFP subunit